MTKSSSSRARPRSPGASLPSDPTTPNKRRKVTSDGDSLQSTPSNRAGSASKAASDAYRDMHVSDVEHPTANDIQDHSQCDFDQFLKTFLVRCHPSKDRQAIDKDALLKKCLEAVLPICRDEDLLDYLTLYCTVDGDEKTRYAPFVQAFNRSLQKLQTIKGHPLRKAHPSQYLFHRNDPNLLDGTYGRLTSKRKPDVVLVTFAAAQRSAGDYQDADWTEFAYKIGTNASQTTFQWTDILMSLEFKRNMAKLKGPRAKYTTELQQSVAAAPGGADIYKCPNGKLTVAAAAAFTRASASMPPPRPYATKGKAKTVSTESHRSVRATTTKSTLVSIEAARAKEKTTHGSASRTPTISGGSGPVPSRHSSYLGKTSSSSSDRPPMVQCAIYAAERLCSSIAVNHAINLLIVDDVAWVWWYDRAGAIQSTGVNIIQDLPRFLVLLLAMQRFSFEDWGVNPELGKAGTGALPHEPLTLTNDKGEKITIYFEEDISNRYTLRGRATRVISAVAKFPPSQTPGEPTPKDRPVAVKVYYPDETRQNEVTIVKMAQTAAVSIPDIEGHIPEIIVACDPGYSTGTIRAELGDLWLAPGANVPKLLRDLARPARVLRVIVFEKLQPIVSQSGPAFLTAWVECLRCHYELWAFGIEHRDPSLDNTMVRVTDSDVPGGKPIISGVMNDWDLANIRDTSQHTGLERTGTLPFQALELLTHKYWQGEIERLYRHDLEALIWVLPWVFLRMNGENTIENPPLEEWQTNDYRTCYKEKTAFLDEKYDYEPTESWQIEWPWGALLLHWLWKQKNSRLERENDAKRNAADNGQLGGKQDSHDVEYKRFWTVYKEAAESLSLNYLVALIPSSIKVQLC
ncbi:hypothetical protein BV25DRAFT_1894866 [Artomyces pyxidatus]|uniref:Uncharacterized protein n=1 Tax=Artomyces pyxidatus TaxID=48021 RepID=A0ACB8SJM9_9AGAM|nr:hypothetical protein BV25DRAFT_1894866 [Artomyces pyxidatus]